MRYFCLTTVTLLSTIFQLPNACADLMHSPAIDAIAAAAAALPDKNAVIQNGFANKATSVDEPMRLVISEKDPANPNKLIERDITVTDIPKYQRPTQNVGEVFKDFLLRVVAAQEAHSKLKAEKIASAINTTLGNGRATATQSTKLASANNPAWLMTLPGVAQPVQIKNGQFEVTGAHKITYGPSAALTKVRNDDIRAAKEHNRRPENVNNQIPVPKPLANNHTGETGDGVQIKTGTPPPPPGTSPGSRGMIKTMNYDLARDYPGEFPGIPMLATGLDANGNSSLIEFGILDIYVASLMPVAGQTDEQIFLELESLLDLNGLSSTYDSFTRSLFLNGVFGDDDTLFWAASDTGFSDFLEVSYGAEDVSEVPEPSAFALLGIGLASFGWLRKRQRERECIVKGSI